MMTPRMLAAKAQAQGIEWPHDASHFVNSKVKDVIFFLREGEDHMETMGFLMVDCDGACAKDITEAYTVVTKEVWDEVANANG